MKEKNIIDLFYDSIGSDTALLDDCALLDFVIKKNEKDEHLLITTDSLSENVHFKLEWSKPEDLAIKLFHVNLSDLSVSGARPRFCLLNLGIPGYISESFLKTFARELLCETAKYKCQIIGGDTFRADSLQLTLTMGGSTSRHVGRSGGRAGDSLYITGDVGLAMAGYKHLAGDIVLPESIRQKAIERHLRPLARSDRAAEITANEKVHATIDISDGIIQDATRLARAGKISLLIEIDLIPIKIELTKLLNIEEVIGSGEEYEILFLGEPGLKFPFPCTRIGRAERAHQSRPVSFIKDGQVLDLNGEGFNHFQEAL